MEVMPVQPKIPRATATAKEPRKPRTSTTDIKASSESGAGGFVKAATAAQKVFRCVRCGATSIEPNVHFYMNTESSLFAGNSYYIPICKHCLQEMYDEYIHAGYAPAVALHVIAHVTDLPYHVPTIEKLVDIRSTKMVDDYVVRLRKNKGSVTDSSFSQGIIRNDIEVIKQLNETNNHDNESEWDEISVKNKHYVLNIVGHDPFVDPNLSKGDRQFLFNTMAGYCPDSSVADDSHKLQSIINIVNMQLQVQKVTNLINAELQKPISERSDIKKLVDAQRSLIISIDSMAEKNEISSNKTGASKGSNTLSGRIRELQLNGFQGIEVNRFDVEQSQVMQQVADISMQAIVHELHLEDNDYSAIVTNQLEMLNTIRAERDKLEEDARLLKNENIQLKQLIINGEGDDGDNQ